MSGTTRTVLVITGLSGAIIPIIVLKVIVGLGIPRPEDPFLHRKAQAGIEAVVAALQAHARDNGGRLPASLQDLVGRYPHLDTAVFRQIKDVGLDAYEYNPRALAGETLLQLRYGSRGQHALIMTPNGRLRRHVGQ